MSTLRIVDPPARTPRVQLPFNLDAEASILGGIILDSALLAELAELEVDDFFDMRHRIVFAAMRSLAARERPLDVVTLECEIEGEGKIDAVGGIAFLGELAQRVPIASNVLAYTETVRQLSQNRRAILALSSALERARSWPHDPAELIIETTGELQRLELDARERAEAKRVRWCLPLPAFLGDQEPDDDDSQDWSIRDLIPRGEPWLWGGPMKGGKTWAAMDLLISLALGEPWLGFQNTLGPARVAGLFLEDNARRIAKRLWELCRARGITPNHPLLRENLRISRAPLRLPDPQHQRRFAAELKAWGARVAVVDNLTRVMIGDPNKTTDAAAFTKSWTEINDETGCALGFLHHTRKGSEQGRGGAPVDPFDLLRGSGDFGATARNIIVTTPIRSEEPDTPRMISEVRMRGNLDLTRDSFVLGFERTQLLDRWQAKLLDRGEIGDVRGEVARTRKEARDRANREQAVAEFHRRQQVALAIVHREKSVSSRRLASELGLKSNHSVQPVLNALVDQGVLTSAGNRGYVIVPDQLEAQL